MREFDLCSDGLFPDPDMGEFGLKNWGFKDIFSYWKYSTLEYGGSEDQPDPYWETDQTAQ